MGRRIHLSSDFNFAATAAHPLAGRKVIEMIPTEWVQKLANEQADDLTDLTPGEPELVSLEELWQDMKKRGMRDPFILSAGRYTGDCRLEAGNHRIKVFALHKVPYVPATVLVADDCLIHEANGAHRYQRDLLIPRQDFTHFGYDDRIYMKPSRVFADIEKMKNKGLIKALTPAG